MLHILGMILKIAGILLGSILGIILLILLLILFMPVRYRVYASYKDRPDVNARISWLLSAFLVRIRNSDQGFIIKVKILGIPLGRRKSGKDEKASNKREAEERRQPEPERADEKKQAQKSDKAAEAEVLPGPVNVQEPDSEQSIRKRFSLAEKIRAWIAKIKCTICSICDKIKEIRLKKEELQVFITNEKNREAFRLIKRQLAYLWKHTRPRKLSVACRFGFDDPSLTGQVLAAGALLYPLYRNKVKLYPDFEQKVLEGEAYMGGRIRIFPLLLIIIRLWKNRQIRDAVRKFME